jgi:hypothetical protein
MQILEAGYDTVVFTERSAQPEIQWFASLVSDDSASLFDKYDSGSVILCCQGHRISAVWMTGRLNPPISFPYILALSQAT